MKLKGLLFLPAAGILAALAMGAAAALNVEGGVNQAGGDTDLTCDAGGSGGFQIGWNNEFSDGAYHTTAVSVYGIDADCVGKYIKVTVTGAGGAEIQTVGGMHTADGNETFPLSTAPLASDVLDVHVSVTS